MKNEKRKLKESMRYQVYIKYSNELTTEIGMFVEPGYIGYYCNNFIFKNDE